jgi:hypothetical protein
MFYSFCVFFSIPYGFVLCLNHYICNNYANMYFGMYFVLGFAFDFYNCYTNSICLKIIC